MQKLLVASLLVLAAGTGPAFAAPIMYDGVPQVQANPRGSEAAAEIAPDPATANSPVAPSLPMDPNYHAGPYVGALSAPPAAALNRTYPACTSAVQDECRETGNI